VRLVTHASTDDPISIQLEQPTPGTTLLRVDGEVDMLTSPTLRRAISDQLATDRLIIDLDGVEFLGTSGLAALVEARAEALERQVELWLVCSTRHVLRPLEIAGLVKLFQITDSVSRALEPTPSDRG
jgi:anti-sigma B factor antagonist